MKQTNENRKALPKFLLALLAAGLIGGLAGGFSVGAGLFLRNHVVADMSGFLQTASLWALPVCSAILLGADTCLYQAAKRTFQRWDGEDEAAMEQAEEQLSWAMLWNSLCMIFNFFFFSAGTVNLGQEGLAPSLLIVVEFVAACFLIIFFQQKIVDLIREINPEKKGSIYDKNFQKIWWESCDEAERRQIGQASYKAFTTVSVLCPVLWGILFFGNIIFQYGILPSAVVLLIWVVQQTAYVLETIKLNRRK